MGKIKKLNQNNEDIFPITHEDAVYDNDGINIGEKIKNINDNMIYVEDFDGIEDITRDNELLTIDNVDFIHEDIVSINIYDKSKSQMGYFNFDTLELTNSTAYRYNKFTVIEGQTIRAVAGSNINYKLFVLLDADDNVVDMTKSDGDFIPTRYYTTIDDIAYHYYEFTIPEGITSVYYQHEESLTDIANMFIVNNIFPSTYVPYEVAYMLDESISVYESKNSEQAEKVVSNLKNKKIGFLGDSFTSSTTYYGTFIQERTQCISYNYGIGGTRITLDSDSGLSFIHRVESLDDDLDIICVFGGINDASKYSLYATNYGTIDDEILTDEEISDGVTEPSTFYSGVKTLISQLIVKYPGKPIVIIIPPHVLDESYAPALTAYNGIEKIVYALRDCAEYYAIPIIDLYKNAQYLNNHPTNVALYRTNTNNIHPNTAAQKLMSIDIQRALEQIIY